MDYNKIIIILVVLLLIVLVAGIFVILNNNASTVNVNNTTCNNTSFSIDVETVNTEEVSSKSSNTHLIMGEDGYYYTCDDNGNILESLGPSKKYHPNNPSAVDYPDAEPFSRYISKG